MHKILILPVVLCQLETWSLTLEQVQRLEIFMNEVLRKTFGPKGMEEFHSHGGANAFNIKHKHGDQPTKMCMTPYHTYTFLLLNSFGCKQLKCMYVQDILCSVTECIM
jgi:hypothetical protein